MAIIFNEEMRTLHQCYKEGWTFRNIPMGLSRKNLKPIFEWCLKTYGPNRLFKHPHMMFDEDYRWVCGNINSNQNDTVEEYIIGFRDGKDLTLFLLKWGAVLHESNYLHT
jgi:hypothetical protein